MPPACASTCTTTQIRLCTIALTVTCTDKQARNCSDSVLPPTEELQKVDDKLSKAERQALFTFSQEVLRKQALKDTKEVIAKTKGCAPIASTCVCMLLPTSFVQPSQKSRSFWEAWERQCTASAHFPALRELCCKLHPSCQAVLLSECCLKSAALREAI